ncbi:MAG: sulfotransferase domain-containing protein [Planctomycetes bacterium]|nr:sulfotransferase domain-containing protein [Planctomycetota bacterium]
MRVVLNKIWRHAFSALTFFLPAEKRIANERRMRGKEEFRKLNLADCVIVSFGKSGRTWLRVMISGFYQKKFGLKDSLMIGFDNAHRKNPGVPKIFFTHDNYLKDFTGHDQDKSDYYGKKVVLLARHPGDVAVSQYFQWQHRMRPHKKKLNAYPDHGDEVPIYDFVVGAEAGLPKIIDYMNLWADEAAKMKELLLVRYEDMKKDPKATLRRIVEFMGTPGSEAELDHAVEYASFDNMRQMEQKKTFWLSGSRMVAKDPSNPHSFKTRRGKVGGFRDYFDDEQEKVIGGMIDSTLSPFYGYLPQEREGEASA